MDEVLEHIYVTEPVGDEFVAVHPEPDLLPWTVALTLGSYSRKHIFRPWQLQRKVVTERMVDFSNRWKWAVQPHDCDREVQLPLVKRRVRECRRVVPAAVDMFLKNTKELVMSHFKAVPRGGEALPGFVKHSLRWLKGHDLRVEVSDKDGVFVVLPRPLAISLARRELSKSHYRAVGAANLEPAFRVAKRGLIAVARHLDRVSSVWAAEVRSKADTADEDSIVCRLQCTVKTHKPVVSLRMVHSSTLSIFNAIGGVINRMLDPLLRSCDFLALGSDDAAQKIRGTVVNPRSILLKFDVKDFYLAGDHALIASTVSDWFPDTKSRKFMFEALSLTLANQFVGEFDSSEQRDVVYHVQTGSGIGMKHAGAVADACFARLVELPLRAEFSNLGVRKYVRFRDDVLVILDDITYTPAFKKAFIGRASKFCEVTVDSFSLIAANFLDFSVRKPKAGSGVVSFQPYVKSTARHIPLGSDSYHSWSTHRSWPLAECQRMFRRSSSQAIGRAWQESKVNHFRRFMLDPEVVLKCSRWRPTPKSEIGQKFLLDRARECAKTIWLILPFRKELRKLQSSLSRLTLEWADHLKGESKVHLIPRVCWSSGGTCLKSLLVQNNRR
jgi:hypothetical protein